MVATWQQIDTTITTTPPNDDAGSGQEFIMEDTNTTTYIMSTTNVNYEQFVEPYTLPFDLLWSFLVLGQDKDFIFEFADLAYNSDIEVTIHDNLRVDTDIDEWHYTKEEQIKVNGYAQVSSQNYTTPRMEVTDDVHHKDEYTTDQDYTTTKTVVTQTNTIKADLTRANTWIVDYQKDYTYSAPSETSSTDKVTKEDENFDDKEVDHTSTDFSCNHVEQAKQDAWNDWNTWNNQRIASYKESQESSEEGEEKQEAPAENATETSEFTAEYKYRYAGIYDDITRKVSTQKYIAGTPTIKEKTDKNSSGGSTTKKNGTGYWWPIGSAETTTENGKLFASGDPELGKANISRMGATGNAYGITVNAHGGNLAIDVGAGGLTNHYNVISIGNGTVTAVGDGVPEGRSDANGGMGNYVIIDYGDITVRFMHLYAGSIQVKTGDEVTYGQVVGKVGHNGDSTGAHMHMDISQGGSFVDATGFVDPDNPRPTTGDSGSSGFGSGKISDLSNVLFVGDSYIHGLGTSGAISGAKFYGAVGEAPSYWNTDANFNTLPTDVDAVVTYLGTNGASESTAKDMVNFIDKLVAKYKGKPIFVNQIMHLGRNYKYADVNTYNSNIDKFNAIVKEKCDKTDNVYYIDTSQGLVDGGYLAHPDSAEGIHLGGPGGSNDYSVWAQNIANAMANTSGSGSSGSGSTTSGGKNFVTIFNDPEYRRNRNNVLSAAEWLFEIIQENSRMSDMLDLVKYLLYKASGNDYGVTEFDFSIFDPQKFQAAKKPSTGGSGGGTSSDLISFIEAAEGGDQYIDGDNYIVYPTPADGCLNIGHGVVVARYGVAWYPDILPNPYDGQVVSRAVYEQIFNAVIKSKSSNLDAALARVGVTLNQNQYDAMIDYCYNCGEDLDIILAAYRDGGNEAWWAQVKQYINPPIARDGLMNRRGEEYELFTTGDYNYNPDYTNHKYY